MHGWDVENMLTTDDGFGLEISFFSQIQEKI